jgi:hypothetical protein
MKVTKVIREEAAVEFHHEVQGHQATEERKIRAHEAPLKSFDETLQSLTDVCVSILELGQSYKTGMKILAVSFSYTKHGTRSASISFSKELSATEAAHRLTTPLFQFDDAADGEDSGRRQCTKKHAELLGAMIVEAENYANGERQQRLLPLDDGKSENAEPQGGAQLPFETGKPGKDGEGDAPPASPEPKKTKKKPAKKAGK